MLSGFGNTLLLGVLGGGAFFGYYTYRYTGDQVETMVEETRKPENSYPGSSVSLLSQTMLTKASNMLTANTFSFPSTQARKRKRSSAPHGSWR